MRTLIVGHRVGAGDVYDRLRDAQLITREVVIPAAGGGGGFTAEPNAPTIPEWWDREIFHTGGACCGGLEHFRTCPNDGSKLSPQEYMALMKHIVGDDAWASLYMQDPLSSEMTTFGALVDACLDRERVVGALEQDALGRVVGPRPLVPA